MSQEGTASSVQGYELSRIQEIGNEKFGISQLRSNNPINVDKVRKMFATLLVVDLDTLALPMVK
jgi:hypothetical protein